MRLILSLIILVTLPFTAIAGEALKVGDNVPASITAKDQFGVERSFSDLVGEKGATLVFFRSADWCPYCQIQLIKLNKDADKFTESGYPLVGVSNDEIVSLKRFEDRLQKMTSAEKSGFTFLSDENSEIIKSFGILNETHKEGSFAYGVPHPAVYIVNKDAKIEAVLQEEGYKDRPANEVIIDAINKL